jgi:arylsulfate sulfotransferase
MEVSVLSPLLFLISLASLNANAAIDFRVYTAQDSPQLLGTVVSVTGLTDTSSGGSVWYRFRTRAAGNSYRMIRDFGPDETLDWTVFEQEGTYELEVTVQDKTTEETVTKSVVFEFLPVVKNEVAVTPTDHPLVYLFSTPPCMPGYSSLARFTTTAGVTQQTPAKACDGLHTMNFLIAGLMQDSEYIMENVVSSGRSRFTTGRRQMRTSRLPNEFRLAAKMPAADTASGSGGFILFSAQPPNRKFASDLDGNVVWYSPLDISLLSRPVAGGRFIGLISIPGGPEVQRVIEFDLLGHRIKETNAARINEQLAAMGKRPIGAFHHDARVLPDGKILVLAALEQTLTDVQGDGPVRIIGDMIVVMDEDLKVVWTWDAFDWLDPKRAAVLDERCGGGSCPAFARGPAVRDWTHGNSVSLASDGSLLYSARHQDWVVKIDFKNGVGDGKILWRLGKDGDFAMDSKEIAPWFSHQHDAHFFDGDMNHVQLFDNGNTRMKDDAATLSRGQAIEIDEVNRTAKLVLNADLGVYSNALGSAQQLTNGHYHFDAGTINNGSSRHMEVDASGKIVRSMDLPTAAYRSFRIADMYSDFQ